jgi:RHS repeat-associated protein
MTFAYDLEGQLSDILGTTYAFDYEHRLVSAGTAEYLYDGDGNRLQATRDGVTTRYIYDDSGNLIAEADEYNTITRYYIYGQGLLAMVNPYNEVYCYHFNATGSIMAITNQNQEIVNKYAYTPFGLIVDKEESIPQPFKYVGEHGVMTEPNGFYYMRARYYDPLVGRFISEDPMGFDGGDVNLYVYASNNPILFADPLGLCSKSPDDLTIWLDVVAVAGDVVSLVPTPYTVIGGYVVSEAAAIANLYRTEKQYKEGKATLIDLWMTRVTTVESTIPGPVGLVGSSAQLIYDILRRQVGP